MRNKNHFLTKHISDQNSLESDRYYLADSMQMNKRKFLAEKFYSLILDSKEVPFIVADEANLYDIYIGNEYELIRKIKQKYGVEINIEQFGIPFWELLDLLEKNSVNNVK